jgi:nicotinamide-nucleotide amidase
MGGTAMSAAEIGRLLVSRGETISVAESVTGGIVQSLVTAVSGASVYFLGGITAYGLEQKVQLLEVDRQQAVAVNCVSPQISQQMAAGAGKLFGSTLALATTGYAEPDEVHGIERPLAHVAIWGRVADHGQGGKLLAHELFHADGPREAVQLEFARSALELLLATLRSMT